MFLFANGAIDNEFLSKPKLFKRWFNKVRGWEKSQNFYASPCIKHPRVVNLTTFSIFFDILKK